MNPFEELLPAQQRQDLDLEIGRAWQRYNEGSFDSAWQIACDLMDESDPRVRVQGYQLAGELLCEKSPHPRPDEAVRVADFLEEARRLYVNLAEYENAANVIDSLIPVLQYADRDDDAERLIDVREEYREYARNHPSFK